jgi:hypothetical protein
MPFTIDYDDAKHIYRINGEIVPSVTQILDTTEAKDALPWWGMRVGMAAVVQHLGTTGWAELANANTPAEIIEGVPKPGSEYYGARDTAKKKPKTLVEALTVDAKVSTNHIKDEAGDRGTSIHAAMEAFAAGVMPDVMEFPEEHRGWIAGLCRWWLEQEPEFLENEVIVGSLEHRYAGRFDTVLTYHAGPHQGLRILTDLKTSKSVYMSHLKQLAGYELAYHETIRAAGDPLEPFDAKHVLHVDRHGGYRIIPSLVEPETFLAAVALHRRNEIEKDKHRHLEGVML